MKKFLIAAVATLFTLTIASSTADAQWASSQSRASFRSRANVQVQVAPAAPQRVFVQEAPVQQQERVIVREKVREFSQDKQFVQSKQLAQANKYGASVQAQSSRYYGGRGLLRGGLRARR